MMRKEKRVLVWTARVVALVLGGLAVMWVADLVLSDRGVIWTSVTVAYSVIVVPSFVDSWRRRDQERGQREAS